MTKIETSHELINRPQAELYSFFIDFNNFEKLLPADKIENWSSTENECSFRIKGMTDIGMEITDSTAHSEINIVSKGKVPFKFTLDIHLEENTKDADTTVFLVFSGDINPFMKMMIEKPLSNFFNLIVKNLANHHS